MLLQVMIFRKLADRLAASAWSRHGLPDLGRMLGVGDHLQLPRLGRQADPGLDLRRQPVRERLPARDVAEPVLGREIGLGGLVLAGRGADRATGHRGRAGRARPEHVAPRDPGHGYFAWKRERMPT
jgi:hypothetical protein